MKLIQESKSVKLFQDGLSYCLRLRSNDAVLLRTSNFDTANQAFNHAKDSGTLQGFKAPY
jgi:hypothetical protein